jgi:hypothetical protein
LRRHFVADFCHGHTAKASNASQIAEEYGFSPRHWANLARRGRIPGVRQPSGSKGRWVFDSIEFAEWWKERQKAALRCASDGAKKPGVLDESNAQRAAQLFREAMGNGRYGLKL